MIECLPHIKVLDISTVRQDHRSRQMSSPTDSNSSVSVWLVSLPDSCGASPSVTRDATSPVVPLKRRRAALTEMSHNQQRRPRHKGETPARFVATLGSNPTYTSPDDDDVSQPDRPTPRNSRDTNIHERLVTLTPPTRSHGQTPLASRSASSRSASSPIKSEDASTNESYNTERGSRARSPVKQPLDLLFADRPVTLVPATTPLPADVRQLDKRLREVSAGVRIIPHNIMTSPLMTRRAEVMDFQLDQDVTQDDAALQRELVELLEISDAAAECALEGASEAMWNDEVHSRLLRLAFRPYPGIRHLNVSQSGPILATKLIDYTVNLEPSAHEKNLIIELIARQPDQLRTVSPSLYSLTRFRPVAFSIETNAEEGSSGMAKTQLMTWAAAHFARLRTLLQSRHGPEEGLSEAMPTHPLILANPDTISIFYAYPHGHEIRVRPAVKLPTPVELVDAYKIVAMLRALGDWCESCFRPWFYEKLLSLEIPR
nr:hypothetical protein CFP56_69112 [Quercus suber]